MSRRRIGPQVPKYVSAGLVRISRLLTRTGNPRTSCLTSVQARYRRPGSGSIQGIAITPQTGPYRAPVARCEAICGGGVRLPRPALVRCWYALAVLNSNKLAESTHIALPVHFVFGQCQTCGLASTARTSRLVMGRIQPTSMAHSRVVLPKNSAATLERIDICHSITHWCVPLVRKPDSPRLPPASTALGGAGRVG
jgi:hypothetical protein